MDVRAIHRPRWPSAVTGVVAVMLAAMTAGCDTDTGPEASQASGSADTSDLPAVEESLRELLPEEIRAAGEIVVGVTPTYPPYESLDPDGETVVGQNADVLAEVGALLGVDIRYEQIMDYSAILTGIEARRYDIGIIFQDSVERQEAVDIVSFYTDSIVFVGHADDPDQGTESLMCGKTVDVGVNSAGALRAEELDKMLCTDQGLPSMELKRSSNSNDQFIALKSRRVDFVTMSPGVGALLEEETDGDLKISTEQFFPQATGIAVSKQLPKLSAALEGALQELIDTGRMREVFERWDTTDLLSKKAGINLATE